MKKLSDSSALHLIGMLSGVALLTLAAVFISEGGVERTTHMVATEVGPQVALSYCTVFHCNNTSYELMGLFPEDTSGNVKTTFAPGETINWQWNAGTYGANTFSGVCYGSISGPSFACAVQQGSPRSDFSSCTGVQNICTHYSEAPFVCDKNGACSGGGQVCDAYQTVYPSKAQCGNADMRYGATCFSASGGTVPSCPGYPGNWPPSTTQTVAPTTPGSYTYYFTSMWLWSQKGMGPLPVTITVANPSCNNGLDIAAYPSCTCPSGQTQSGSTCTPTASCTNGLNNSYAPACVCPSGQVQSGSTCVPATCANGLDSSYAPSCTCPSGQTQSGSTCVSASCANGLSSQYAPGCTCPSGQVQSGSVCVSAPTSCGNGLDNSYLPSCVCPSGQVQSGTTCVAPGSINNLSSNPSRVRKGGTIVLSWNTSNMESCVLRGPSAGLITTLSTAVSGTLSRTVTNQSVYTLTCVDSIGTSRTQSVTVNIVPETIEQ